jgi:hypothetical protein
MQTIDKTVISMLLLMSALASAEHGPHPMRFVALKKSTKTTATPKGVTKG